MTALGVFVTRDPTEIRDSFCRTMRNGLIERGVANPNVTPSSDWYVLGTAIGLQCAVVEANCAIKSEAQMPDTAVGDELARWAAIFGLSKQAAAGSTGGVVLESSAATTVATGTQLYDDAGLRYEVTIGGVYSDGDTIPIAAISTGTATNHAEDDVLRWVTTPAFADEQALVASGGLVNAADEEDDEALRARVLAYMQNAPRSGDWEHACELAEASTSRVQKAFAYPAIQGPGSYHLAVTAAPTSTNRSRVVEAATVTGTVSPYVLGKMPTHAYGVITATADVNTDVAFSLTLPEAPTASPPGLGGGWKDGSPWPAPDGSATFRCTVTAVTSDLVFTVDATTPPQAGISHIAWLSPSNWRLYRAVVASFTGTSGAYVVTLDAPLTGIATGDYVWPDCVQAETYASAILDAFELMGPGQKSSNASALIRGFRHPPPNTSWPYSLGAHLLRALTNSGEEVSDAGFLHRTDGTTTLTGSSGQVNPQLPAAVTDAPKIFIPRRLAFYRSP